MLKTGKWSEPLSRMTFALESRTPLHVLVPEVVWDEAGQPLELPPPDEGAVEAVLARAVRQLVRRWPSEEVPWEEDEYRQLQQAAVQARLALEVPPRRRRGLVAVVEPRRAFRHHGPPRPSLPCLCDASPRCALGSDSRGRLPRRPLMPLLPTPSGHPAPIRRYLPGTTATRRSARFAGLFLLFFLPARRCPAR
jgi:hypothetical protein